MADANQGPPPDRSADETAALPSPGEATPRPLESGTIDLAGGSRPQDSPPQSSTDIPSRRFSRYEIQSLLGAGGMGKVVKASDPTLGRMVALKLLRSSGGDVDRFLQEARAQARVDHPNICKVYEAGVYEGEPYIAMQYIEGQTLGQAARAMTLEQKVRVVRVVAEALQAAHREGLIHRDMKPGNVMVSRDEAGKWTPFVMDFGLARLGDSSQTMDGTVLGTPSFMAPEQARGEANRVDRRTDIYGLGATLYDLLTERPPFQGDSPATVILRVIQDDPAPPRELDPSLPRDLETIVLKCLSKEPQHRYESARAMADDLGRYLDGEPVEARRAGLLYRLGKRARKHKVATAALAFALIAVATGSGLALRSSYRAAERERLASRFSEVGRDMEAVMERTHLLPLHDVSYAKDIVRKRMTGMREEMARAGDVAQASGHFALGRGHLALGEFAPARQELQDAIERYGSKEKAAAYDLGTVLLELYRVELQAAQRLQNSDSRRERMALIDRTLREPALRYLRLGREAGNSPEYAESLLAFLDRDYPKAIALAGQAEQRSPWLYAASILRGDGQVQLGNTLRDLGRREEARIKYDLALQAYEAAARKGGSDPRCYLGLAQLRLDEMYMESIQTGRSMKEAFEDAQRACQQALSADPSNALAYGLLSNALWRWGTDLAGRGEDPSGAYQEAITAAEKAVSLDPLDERTFKSLGDSCYQFSFFQYQYDRPARELLEKSIAAYLKAIALNPQNPALHSNLGNAYQLMPVIASGLTAEASLAFLKKAEASFREAIRLAPQESDYWNNLGSHLYQKGQDSADRGEDPSASWNEAILALQEAIRLNPENTSAYNNLGATNLLIAGLDVAARRDPGPRLESALASYAAFIQRNPSNPIVWRNMGDTFLTLAKYRPNSGGPGNLSKAQSALNHALALKADDSESYLLLADAYMVEAEWSAARQSDPGPPLARAETALRRAESISGGIFSCLARRQALELLRARFDLSSGRSPEDALARAEAAARTAVAREPEFFAAHVLLAKALERRADWELRRQPRKAAGLLSEALGETRAALAGKPGDAECLALSASMLAMQARLEGDPARQAALLSEARDALLKAMAAAPGTVGKECAPLAKSLGLPPIPQ